MTDEIIKQIPDIINDPIAILEAKEYDTRVVMVSDIFTSDEKNIIVVLELEPVGKHGMKIDEIKAASSYAKKNIQNMIMSSRVVYITENKRKAANWSTTTRLQLPFGYSNNNFYKDSIPQSKENATQNFEEQQYSDRESEKEYYIDEAETVVINTEKYSSGQIKRTWQR